MIINPLASGSSGNAYCVSDGETPLLLEAGIPWKKIQKGLNFHTSELAGCLITHGHQDHCSAAKDVIKAGIDIWASPPTFSLLGLSGHCVHPIEAGEQVKVGTWIVKAFEAQHDCEGALGFLLYSTATGEKLAYLTDTYYCRYRFRGLTHIMVEANYAADILQANVESGALPVEMKNRLLRSHFSLENVKKFLRDNDLRQVREIHLIHLSDGNSDATRFKREIEAVTGKPVYIAGEG